MPGSLCESPDHSVEANKIYQSTFVHSSSGLTSKNSVQLSTGASYLRTETVELLSDIGYLEQFGKTRTSLMDRKFENIKWEKNETPGTPCSNTDI